MHLRIFKIIWLLTIPLCYGQAELVEIGRLPDAVLESSGLLWVGERLYTTTIPVERQSYMNWTPWTFP